MKLRLKLSRLAITSPSGSTCDGGWGELASSSDQASGWRDRPSNRYVPARQGFYLETECTMPWQTNSVRHICKLPLSPGCRWLQALRNRTAQGSSDNEFWSIKKMATFAAKVRKSVWTFFVDDHVKNTMLPSQSSQTWQNNKDHSLSEEKIRKMATCWLNFKGRLIGNVRHGGGHFWMIDETKTAEHESVGEHPQNCHEDDRNLERQQGTGWYLTLSLFWGCRHRFIVVAGFHRLRAHVCCRWIRRRCHFSVCFDFLL